jgi:hypothetical protein
MIEIGKISSCESNRGVKFSWHSIKVLVKIKFWLLKGFLVEINKVIFTLFVLGRKSDWKIEELHN